MPSWNETHYSRAEEFTQLLAGALSSATPSITPKSAPPLRASPLTPPAPAPESSPAPTAQSPAANLFKKIPWKK